MYTQQLSQASHQQREADQLPALPAIPTSRSKKSPKTLDPSKPPPIPRKRAAPKKKVDGAPTKRRATTTTTFVDDEAGGSDDEDEDEEDDDQPTEEDLKFLDDTVYTDTDPSSANHPPRMPGYVKELLARSGRKTLGDPVIPAEDPEILWWASQKTLPYCRCKGVHLRKVRVARITKPGPSFNQIFFSCVNNVYDVDKKSYGGGCGYYALAMHVFNLK